MIKSILSHSPWDAGPRRGADSNRCSICFVKCELCGLEGKCQPVAGEWICSNCLRRLRWWGEKD